MHEESQSGEGSGGLSLKRVRAAAARRSHHLSMRSRESRGVRPRTASDKQSSNARESERSCHFAGKTIKDLNNDCSALEFHRPAIWKGWSGLGGMGSMSVFKGKMPSPDVLSGKVGQLMKGASCKWKSTNADMIWNYEPLSEQDLDMAWPNRKALPPESFSKFQEEALLKNVNLKAPNHMANMTDSASFLRHHALVYAAIRDGDTVAVLSRPLTIA